MVPLEFTCPRCLFTEPLRPEMQFCPRCGLPNAREAALDSTPTKVVVGHRVFKVMDRLAIGSVCCVYRCRFESGSKQVEGIFKIARDACTNELVSNEATILRQLLVSDKSRRFGPFLPKLEETMAMGDGAAEPARIANILRMDDQIRSPDELYTLAEIRSQYPNGLDARHVAWIWRRLLSVLGFVHGQDVVHGGVLPMHVLVEPLEHKLLLIDWCCAVDQASKSRQPIAILAGGYHEWYKREDALRLPPARGLDVGLGARCMIELLGGDAELGQFPSSVEPGLQRHFTRCLGGESAIRPDALKLLDEFDRLIKDLAGPKQLPLLTMPRKPKP